MKAPKGTPAPAHVMRFPRRRGVSCAIGTLVARMESVLDNGPRRCVPKTSACGRACGMDASSGRWVACGFDFLGFFCAGMCCGSIEHG